MRWQVLGGMAIAAMLVVACAEMSRIPRGADVGPDPVLSEPVKEIFPTVNVAEATGWPAGGKPQAAPGLQVKAFAEGLQHPRTVLVLPNGDVLVAETNAPERPEEGKGIKAKFM